MNITIYTQDQCPPCQYIKNYLREHDIDFTEKNIKHMKYKIEMIDMDAMSTPLVIIDDTVYRTLDMDAITQQLQGAL